MINDDHHFYRDIPTVVQKSLSGCTLNANYVDGSQREHGVVQLQGGNGPFTALGNIVGGTILINDTELPERCRPLDVEMA